MKELSIKRALSESTKKQEIRIRDEVYSLHLTTNGETIITDVSDYAKIYSVQSIEFYEKVIG